MFMNNARGDSGSVSDLGPASSALLALALLVVRLGAILLRTSTSGGVGPLPQGEYLMRVVEHKRFAPPAIRLTQEKGQTYGRSGFLIHGGTKSEGCIILDRYARQAIAATLGLRGGTATLAVIAG